MHVAQGLNMAVFRVNVHWAKPTVWRCRSPCMKDLSNCSQGKAHPNAPRNAEPRTFGPVVDELFHNVTWYTRKKATTNMIALLHYRIKSKEVRLLQGRHSTKQADIDAAQDFERKGARGYPNNRFDDSIFSFIDDRATADCTLAEYPDLDLAQDM